MKFQNVMGITDVGASIIVAFIISGCLFKTYYKVMKMVLGIDCYHYSTYDRVLKRLHPVVNEMCEDAKNDMKCISNEKLGSWKQAVTSADGVWHTRGYHSKNGSFTVRNYINGALLYYAHLSQKGSDTFLYEGTSKSMEGFAANEIMNQAKREGMDIAVQWQDSDASCAKSIQDVFPNCKIMICGGHAGKNHLKMLESYATLKSPTARFIKMHMKDFLKFFECPLPL